MDSQYLENVEAASVINALSKILETTQRRPILHALQLRSGASDAPRVTPAVEAAIADHVWSIEEIVGLLETR
jgi:hypothetical protein